MYARSCRKQTRGKKIAVFLPTIINGEKNAPVKCAGGEEEDNKQRRSVRLQCYATVRDKRIGTVDDGKGDRQKFD